MFLAQTACETFDYGEVEDYTVNIKNAAVSYCASQGNDASYEWIAGVAVSDLNNSTGSDGGYADFTNITANMALGSSYAVSLSPGFSGSTYNEYWKVWIDFNKDGDFTDANELVFDAGSLSSSTVNGTLSIPSTVQTGTTRMRVSMKYNGSQGSCEAFSYGEVEDYTVNITSSSSKDNPTASIEDTEVASSALSVYPNPAQSNITLELSGFNETADIVIVNTQGQVVFNDRIAVMNALSKHELSLGHLERGTYFIIAREDDKVERTKLVLIH